MKLSKAQKEILKAAKAKIDYTRSHTLIEWATKETGWENLNEVVARRSDKEEKEMIIKRANEVINSYATKFKESYEASKRGEVLISYVNGKPVNSKSLEKLQQYGLIEIIFDSNGYAYGIDTIKVLNY